MDTIKYDAFVSFSFKDYDLAYGIVRELRERHGLTCWICTQELRGGTSYKSEIVRAIGAANALVLVGTCHSLASDQVASEIGFARNNRKKIIPFMCDQTEPTGEIAYDLGALHRIPAFVPPLSDRVDELAAVLKSISVQAGAVPAVQPAPPAPAPAPAPTPAPIPQPAPVKIEKAKKSKKGPAIAISSALVIALLAGGGIWLGSSMDQSVEDTEPKQTEAGTPGDNDPNQLADQEYLQAQELYDNGNYAAAAIAFSKLGDYKDAADRCAECWKLCNWINHSTVTAGNWNQFWIGSDHALKPYLPYETMREEDWSDLVSVVKFSDSIAGITSSGELRFDGAYSFEAPDPNLWYDLVSISGAGYDDNEALVGLKSDGSVIAVGTNQYGECDVESWKDIVSVRTYADGDYSFTVGIDANGTALVTGNEMLQSMLAITDRTDLAYVCSNPLFVVDRSQRAHFLLSVDVDEADEDVIALIAAIESIPNVKDVMIGYDDILILRTDGSLTTIGDDLIIRENVNHENGFYDLVAIVADGEAVLRADGTVLLMEDTVWLDTPEEKSVLVPVQPSSK